MKTYLKLEKFNEDDKLVETKEQLSRSYTFNFIKALYQRFTQTSPYFPLDANLLQAMVGPGGLPVTHRHDTARFGIVVGKATTPPVAGDHVIRTPFSHGTRVLGANPQPVNPSFETGNFEGWSSSGWSITGVGGFWPGFHGTYCATASSGTCNLSQNVDLTNATLIRFGMYTTSTGFMTMEFRIGGVTVFSCPLPFGPMAVYVPVSYSGIQTITFYFFTNYSGRRGYVDNVYIYGDEIWYGACEVEVPTYAGANGELAMRRHFRNLSTSNLTINEVGLISFPECLLIARDVVSGGITMLPGETLRVSYIMRITV